MAPIGPTNSVLSFIPTKNREQNDQQGGSAARESINGMMDKTKLNSIRVSDFAVVKKLWELYRARWVLASFKDGFSGESTGMRNLFHVIYKPHCAVC